MVSSTFENQKPFEHKARIQSLKLIKKSSTPFYRPLVKCKVRPFPFIFHNYAKIVNSYF